MSTYQASAGKTSCSTCPENTETNQTGQNSAKSCLCSEGYYGPTEGLANQSGCVVCPPGHFCMNGVSVACNENTYNLAVGQPSRVACRECPRFSSSRSGAAALSDCLCSPG